MNTSETEIFAHIGKKQIELDNTREAFAQINTEYDRLLELLSKVVSGEIPSEQVAVDLAGRRWAHTPGQTPAVEETPAETP
jgi:hypothetical protein